MRDPIPADLSVVTVATEAFVPGARVMFASFLRTHPGFQGELVVIHAGLSDLAIGSLKAISPRLRMVHAGSDLVDRMGDLARAIPGISATSNRFLSLEALRQTSAQRVLLCDSDIVFLKPVTALLESTCDVAAVGDGCFLRGNGRDPRTLAEGPARAGALSQTFNAGIMALGRNALTGADFEAALAEMSVERFAQLQGGLHDQAIYNLIFDGRMQLFDWRYNYLLKHHDLIQSRRPVARNDIRVLHFNQGAKPWTVSTNQIAAIVNPMRQWAMFQWQAVFHALPR